MVIQKNVLILGISIVTAVVATVYWWQQRPADPGAALTPPTSTTPLPSVSSNKRQDYKNESMVQGKSATAAQAPISIRQRMKSAKDHFALAKQLLPLARAGDPEAQFVMFQTYRGCTYLANDFKKYGTETLEKMREMAQQYNYSVADQEAKFQRCQAFYTDEAASLGDPWDWLQKATDAGYAPAQAETALERLRQDRLKAEELAAGYHDPTYVHDPVESRPPVGGDSTPRELLIAAAQSADPDVLTLVGNEQLMLHPQQPRAITQLDRTAWFYVACQRGFDCSEFGPASLANCGPNDGNCTPVPNTFLQWVNNDWAPVQERVNQTNAALAAKQWDKLPGLAPGE